MNSFLDLPNEVIVNHIVHCLDHTSKANFSYTCKRFRNLTLTFSKDIIFRFYSIYCNTIDLREFIIKYKQIICIFRMYNVNIIIIFENVAIKNMIYIKPLLYLSKRVILNKCYICDNLRSNPFINVMHEYNSGIFWRVGVKNIINNYLLLEEGGNKVLHCNRTLSLDPRSYVISCDISSNPRPRPKKRNIHNNIWMHALAVLAVSDITFWMAFKFLSPKGTKTWSFTLLFAAFMSCVFSFGNVNSICKLIFKVM